MLNTYINSTIGVLLFFLQYSFKNILFLPNLPYNLSKGDVIDRTTNLKDRT